MNRRLALLVSVFAAVAVAAGVLAVARVSASGAGTGTSTVSNAQIAAEQRRLDRFEASLRQAREQRPPALPPLSGSAEADTSSRTVYVQGAQTAISHDDAEHEDEHGEEAEHEDEAEHAGEGFDD